MALVNFTARAIATLNEIVARWPDIKSALRLRGSITGSGAARVTSGPGGVVVHVDGPAKADTPVAGARLVLFKCTGTAAGTNKFVGDAYAPGKGLSDPTSASLTDNDLGAKVFVGALFTANGDVPIADIRAGWIVGYTADGKAALVSLGGGGSLPSGEFQGMVFQNVTDNQTGFDWIRGTARPPT